MELWIRSQDRKQLLKVNDGLFIISGFDGTDSSLIGIKNVGHVGKYKTLERALEVLNEIQNLLQPKITYNRNEPVETIEHGVYKIKGTVDMKIQEVNRIVYEMPKE